LNEIVSSLRKTDRGDPTRLADKLGIVATSAGRSRTLGTVMPHFIGFSPLQMYACLK